MKWLERVKVFFFKDISGNRSSGDEVGLLA
jgi:hypothetical protein